MLTLYYASVTVSSKAAQPLLIILVVCILFTFSITTFRCWQILEHFALLGTCWGSWKRTHSCGAFYVPRPSLSFQCPSLLLNSPPAPQWGLLSFSCFQLNELVSSQLQSGHHSAIWLNELVYGQKKGCGFGSNQFWFEYPMVSLSFTTIFHYNASK